MVLKTLYFCLSLRFCQPLHTWHTWHTWHMHSNKVRDLQSLIIINNNKDRQEYKALSEKYSTEKMQKAEQKFAQIHFFWQSGDRWPMAVVQHRKRRCESIHEAIWRTGNDQLLEKNQRNFDKNAENSQKNSCFSTAFVTVLRKAKNSIVSEVIRFWKSWKISKSCTEKK